MWFFRIFSWFIATGYFFLFPVRVAHSLKFYRALFPERNFPYHFFASGGNIINLDVFLHHFLLQKNEWWIFTSDGWEHLEEAVKKKTGAIIVMSHVGNWELAAQMMNRKGFRSCFIWAQKHKEQIERMQKETLAQSGIRIVATSEEGKFALCPCGRNQFPARRRHCVHDWRPSLGRADHVLWIFWDMKYFAGYAAFVCPDDWRAADDFFCVSGSCRKIPYQSFPGRKVLAASRADRKKAVLESAQAYAEDLASFPPSIPSSGITLSRF